MTNQELESFLDTGWYNEATLFYGEYVYWCEGYTTGRTNHFFVDRWKAECNNNLYHSYIDTNNEFIDYCRIFETEADNMEINKKNFLSAPIFNGKTFWEIYQKIEWVDEGNPIVYK